MSLPANLGPLLRPSDAWLRLTTRIRRTLWISQTCTNMVRMCGVTLPHIEPLTISYTLARPGRVNALTQPGKRNETEPSSGVGPAHFGGGWLMVHIGVRSLLLAGSSAACGAPDSTSSAQAVGGFPPK